jgi:acetate kinase
MIEEMMRRAPDVVRFACFDTVFHETMPEEATVYALSAEVRAEGVRRYGFHGLSCESVVWQMRAALGSAFPRRLVIAHLGSGCSVTACVDGKSVDTTMGLTPTGGVVMGTRPGDLDPGVVLYLLRRQGATAESVEKVLNHDSGLKALGGINDMRELRKSAAGGDEAARLAIKVFCRSVVKAIAGFIALYGADAIVFTGGIGEHDADSRAEIAGALGGLGVVVGMESNRIQRSSSGEDEGQTARRISGENSAISVYVVPAEEDRMIARHVAQMCHVSLPSDEWSS